MGVEDADFGLWLAHATEQGEAAAAETTARLVERLRAAEALVEDLRNLSPGSEQPPPIVRAAMRDHLRALVDHLAAQHEGMGAVLHNAAILAATGDNQTLPSVVREQAAVSEWVAVAHRLLVAYVAWDREMERLGG